MESRWISLMLLTAISLSGCNQQTIEDPANPEIQSNKAYDSKEAVKKGDIVFHNKVLNVERFEQFLNNLSKKKEDTIRITGYTHEGDPIFQDLKYDGKIIRYSYDDSHDAFGGSSKGLREDVCTRISEELVNGEIEYTITGCSENSKDMSYFLLRVPK